MGTNYYLMTNCCDKCHRAESEIHIGKSSAGWCFSLHVIPEDGINDLPDWQDRWSKPGAKIRDEYGNEVMPEEMLAVITDRKWIKQEKPYGYESWPDFYRRNHGMEGPNGLTRHDIFSRNVAGHGAGTWDLITGEFS